MATQIKGLGLIMPTAIDYETVKQQCNALRAIGAYVTLDISNQVSTFGEPIIQVSIKSKNYHFSDPSWYIIIKQLAQLYWSIKNEKN